MSELDEEFKKIIEVVMPQIKDKIEKARALLMEACELSESNNIPFTSSISYGSNKYIPYEANKWMDVDSGLMYDLTGVYNDELENDSGWQEDNWNSSGCSF